MLPWSAMFCIASYHTVTAALSITLCAHTIFYVWYSSVYIVVLYPTRPLLSPVCYAWHSPLAVSLLLCLVWPVMCVHTAVLSIVCYAFTNCYARPEPLWVNRTAMLDILLFILVSMLHLSRPAYSRLLCSCGLLCISKFLCPPWLVMRLHTAILGLACYPFISCYVRHSPLCVYNWSAWHSPLYTHKLPCSA